MGWVGVWEKKFFLCTVVPVPSLQLDATELLLATAGGDVAAFEQLFGLLHKRVYGLALRVVIDPALAEDVAHEAFLSVWHSAHSFDPDKGSAEGWVLAMAHRRAVDLLRSRQSQNRRTDTFTQQMQSTGVEEPADSRALQLDEHAALAQCFEGLTLKQREAVTLAYFQGLSYKQVAERLGATHSAIKTRLRDAMASLRRCMGS